MGIACFLCAIYGQQLTFVDHEDVDNFERKSVSDRLQWPGNNIHNGWKHKFEHQPQKDFVEMVHIVFMNHLGMKECHYNMIVYLLFCCLYHGNLT